MPTIHALLSWAENLLQNAGISSPRADAEWMLTYVLTCSRSELYLHQTQTVTHQQTTYYRELISQRAKRIPLQHLLGQTEFYGLPFYTTPDALIPRPETETLVEIVIDHLKDHANPRILDIGTGSGIIAIALAKELPKSHIIAVDISLKALRLASQNARLNNVSDRISFLQTDLLAPFAPPEHFHAIISNPPYIPSSDINTLEPEVRAHDPQIALDGGSDGLDFYRKLIPDSIPLLAQGGLIGFEIGHNQADPVTQILTQQTDLTHIFTHTDLSNHPRVVLAQKQT
ncbi:MAG: peptide chain release factor N(5)-glutamine methyltransferase [Candidatus Latescibacteria bacterium]|jgi:release factor glutamine methyltransferase|nr:peptide chain release factor N(5)-glutamine methyltransferase [Candidatus Latescibacterota bacterium]